MVRAGKLVDYLNELLEVNGIADAAVNGLQVKGSDEVKKVGLAVDAGLSVYKKAVEVQCQMLIVHHGLIWGGIRSLTGRALEHVKYLLDNELNLYAAHLPLDAHSRLGNNAVLSGMADLKDTRPFGEYHGTMLGFRGTLPCPMNRDDFMELWSNALGCRVETLPFGPNVINTVAVVSGRAGALTEAIEAGVDCLVTGEGKHEEYHEAIEGGINVFYLGHYYSETVGVKALGDELANKFSIETVFIDEPTGF